MIQAWFTDSPRGLHAKDQMNEPLERRETDDRRLVLGTIATTATALLIAYALYDWFSVRLGLLEGFRRGYFRMSCMSVQPPGRRCMAIRIDR